MFPFQESNNVWYIYYPNPKTGKRTKKSTRIKSEKGSKVPVKVMQFFVKFQKEYEHNKQSGIKSVTISEFANLLLMHYRNGILDIFT